MNSRVLVRDLDAGAAMELTLVYPLGANSRIGRVSVLAPIGMALLGYPAGDTVVWRVPSGMRRLRIERVLYQPEAAGHFHLSQCDKRGRGMRVEVRAVHGALAEAMRDYIEQRLRMTVARAGERLGRVTAQLAEHHSPRGHADWRVPGQCRVSPVRRGRAPRGCGAAPSGHH